MFHLDSHSFLYVSYRFSRLSVYFIQILTTFSMFHIDFQDFLYVSYRLSDFLYVSYRFSGLSQCLMEIVGRECSGLQGDSVPVRTPPASNN